MERRIKISRLEHNICCGYCFNRSHLPVLFFESCLVSLTAKKIKPDFQVGLKILYNVKYLKDSSFLVFHMLELFVRARGGCVISASSQRYSHILPWCQALCWYVWVVDKCNVAHIRSKTLPAYLKRCGGTHPIALHLNQRDDFGSLQGGELQPCGVFLRGMLRVVDPEPVRWVEPWQRACSRGTSTNQCMRNPLAWPVVANAEGLAWKEPGGQGWAQVSLSIVELRWLFHVFKKHLSATSQTETITKSCLNKKAWFHIFRRITCMMEEKGRLHLYWLLVWLSDQ